MTEIYFKVLGDPKGKGRPRFSRVGKFTKTYTDAKTKMYENEIANAARIAMDCFQGKWPHEPLETPLSVTLIVHVGVPASYSKKRTTACLIGEEWPTKKPDIDNIAKAFLDAMNGIVYKDDVQVIRLHVYKKYSIEPGVHITVHEVLP
jgi:Holliday junction resolvase RusA-like endonuclease